MNNRAANRWGCGCGPILGVLALVLVLWFAWSVYNSMESNSLEIAINCRMRCTYNYPDDAKLVKHTYANGIAYYRCEEQ